MSQPQVIPENSIRAKQAVPTDVAFRKFPALTRSHSIPLLMHQPMASSKRGAVAGANMQSSKPVFLLFSDLEVRV